MGDIVERLRARASWEGTDAIISVLMVSAADEIDAIRAAQQAKVPDARVITDAKELKAGRHYLVRCVSTGNTYGGEHFKFYANGDLESSRWLILPNQLQGHEFMPIEAQDPEWPSLSAQSAQDGKPAIAHNGVVMQDDANRRDFD